MSDTLTLPPATETGTLTDQVSDREGLLRRLAEARGLSIGAAVDMAALGSDAEYTDTLSRNFNMCVAENAFKQYAVWMGPFSYDFQETDRLTAFAQDQQMTLRGHTLVWHDAIPKWLLEGDFTADQISNMLHAYIHTYVSRYAGIVKMWDVVNEAMTDGETSGYRENSFWYQTLGPDYLKMVFTWAHEADPEAKLYYNDYEAENLGSKANAIYDVVRGLVSDGIPIHGVGLQYHCENGWRVTDDHRANVRRIAALGLDWQVTECDIRMFLDGHPPTEVQLLDQAEGYRDLMNLCLTEARCTGFVIWGFTDARSWIPKFRRGWGASLPFDADYCPKAAYVALCEALGSP